MRLVRRSLRETELEGTVRAQARIRAFLGMPLVLLGGSAFYFLGGGNPLVPLLGLLQISYVIVSLFLARHASGKAAEYLLIATAVLDPLVLSIWLPLMNEYGGLVVGFYLFTILGFGFRTGIREMRVCQIASIAGFSTVMLVVPFWRQHSVIWLSFLITLIVVPLYATTLIRKLQEARAHAEQESLAKSDLLARVSHELRTPLSGIMAATQLLGLETSDLKAQKRADTILGLSRDLLHEINDLLDQSKYESKALVLETAPIQLMEQMDRVRLTMEAAASKKGLALRTSIDPRIIGWVLGDAHYLSRVLLNLAGNAIKFTDKGEVLIGMHLIDEVDDEYRVRFTVEDTGIGIAREHHDKIFEPFFQAEGGGTTRKYGGTGLGMTIARDVVKLMGGELRLASEPGKGSLFYFEISFPRVIPPETSAADNVPVSIMRSKRVFVVDDHETNLMLIKELLEQDGHQVTTASNGMDALQALGAQEFDMAFLDYNLGDMDGVKLLQIYRFGKLNPIPVCFLTADATLITGEKLKNSGASCVLTKPVSLADLRRVIHQCCADADTNANAAGSPLGEGPPWSGQQKAARPILKAVPAQPLDMSVISHLRSISGRPAFLRELLMHAEGDIRRNCDELDKELTTHELENVRDTAHALKGVCASIGAVRLMTLANSLMRMGRDEIRRNASRLRSELSETSLATVSGIQGVLGELDSEAVDGRSTASLHSN